MKKELWVLAVWGVRGRKRSSFLLLIVLILSFTVAVISLSVTESMRKTNEEYRYDTYGAWYGAITSGKEEDEAFLEECEGIENVGITKSYGMVASNAGMTGIGTMDDAFCEIGRISLQDGYFPRAADEIAMEASLLSGLGYDYELGQEIVLDVGFYAGSEVLYTQRTYKLCGVIKAYTKLWASPANAKSMLNGAVITQEAADELLVLKDEAVEAYNEEMTDNLAADEVMPQYYFSVKAGMEEETEDQVNAYLTETRGVPLSVMTNSYISGTDEGVYTFTYAILTYIVTLLAVVCIYTIQMQKQVKQIALFRSVGITKSQLRWMSFFETVCISIPAVAAGVICGSIGIRIILHLLVYAGSVDVFVVIPLSVILPLILLWIAGIFVMRVLVLQIALRQPLTGRLAMSQRKVRKVRILRRAEIILLSSLFCITLFFTAMQSMTQIYWIRYWKSQACYIMYTGAVSSWDSPENVNVLSKERFEMYRQIPGVSWINGYSRAQVKLEFEGSENNEFYNAQLALSQAWNADNLYTVPEEKWDDFFGKNNRTFDAEAFRNGEQVYVSFFTDENGNYILFGMEDDQRFEDTGLNVGDEITLKFDGFLVDGDQLKEKKGVCSVTTQVGGILDVGDEVPGTQGMLTGSYIILCSEQFLQNIVSQAEPGYILSGYYNAGEEIGYTLVYGSADQNAGYLSTDYVMAEFCGSDHLSLDNLREAYEATVQKYMQTILLLCASGICIMAVLLLIIGNTLALEAIVEKRKYGILQAIGMSARQMKREILKRSLLCSIAAVIAGCVVYGGYLLLGILRFYYEEVKTTGDSVQEYAVTWIGKDHIRPGAMPALVIGAIIILLLIWWLAKRSLFREDLMDKLQDRN